MKKIFSRFSKREQLLFIFVAAAIFAIIAYVFIAEPVYKKWSGLELKLDTSRSRLLKNTKLLHNKEFLQKQYERCRDYLGQEADSEEEMAAALKEIETTASNCGVKITTIKPKGQKQLKDYKIFEVELTSEGQMSQFIKFIYDIENSKKLLKVRRLVLTLKSSQQPDILKGAFLIYKISLTN